MARESFLLRIDPKILASLRQWSEDEMRSVNAQIEFLLRNALRNAGRMPTAAELDLTESDAASDVNSPPPANPHSSVKASKISRPTRRGDQ